MNPIPTFTGWGRAVSRVAWKVAPVCGWLVAALGALVVTVHLVEYGRGKRAWESSRALAEARGVEYSLEKLIPTADVPEEQNFAQVPLIRAAVLARKGEGP